MKPSSFSVDTSKPLQPPRSFRRRPTFWLLMLVLVLLAGILVWYQQLASASKKSNHAAYPLQVVAATANSAAVPVYLSALGTVTPTYSVTIRTQINGRLIQVLFREGQMVKAFDRDQDKLLATGELLTIDNQIDPTTGTVKLKAQFANEDYRLFPNQFVNVRLLIDTLQHATVVPTAAIQHGISGTFVYALNGQDSVRITPVVVGVTSGDNSTITTGISPGQQVVEEGADKLIDGAKVVVAKIG